jgi:hypothetical protein
MERLGGTGEGTVSSWPGAGALPGALGISLRARLSGPAQCLSHMPWGNTVSDLGPRGKLRNAWFKEGFSCSSCSEAGCLGLPKGHPSISVCRVKNTTALRGRFSARVSCAHNPGAVLHSGLSSLYDTCPSQVPVYLFIGFYLFLHLK